VNEDERRRHRAPAFGRRWRGHEHRKSKPPSDPVRFGFAMLALTPRAKRGPMALFGSSFVSVFFVPSL
jgi:hypothetical protein